MSDHVYGIIEVAGSSTESHDDAIKQAVEKAAQLYSHLNWYEVKEMRGHITDGKIEHYQVVIKIGHRFG